MKKILIALIAIFLTSNLFGAKVTFLRTSIAEEGFQMYIAADIVKRLGYDVEITNDVSYEVAYQTIAQNAKSKDAYIMAAAWIPLHNSKIKGAGGSKKIDIIGSYIKNCAQGYLIDKKQQKNIILNISMI